MKKILYIFLFLSLGVFAQQNRNVVIAMLGTNQSAPAPNEDLLFTSTSTSATWSPLAVTNSGATLTWTASGGGITLQSSNSNDPTFDLSANTGTVTIVVESTDSFSGLTNLRMPNLGLVTVDVTNATSLDVLFLYTNQIANIDITPLTSLTRIWLQVNELSTIDISQNTLLEQLDLEENNITTLDITTNTAINDLQIAINNIPSVDQDAIVNQLDTNNLTSGNLEINVNNGALTESSYTGYNNLITDTWTIDVSAPPSSGDTTDPSTPVLAYANETSTTVELSATSTDNVGVTSFDIFKDAVFLENVQVSELINYLVTGLTASTNYDFTVYAKDAVPNTSIVSNTVNFTTSASTDSSPPTAPILTYSTKSTNSVNLLWTASTDNVAVTNYKVFKDGNLETTLGNVLTYNVTGLSSSTNHNFEVSALDASSNESTKSNTLNVTTNAQATGTTPLITNFRVNNTNKDRVYFDAYGDISTLNTTGFTISGKTISAVSTTGNYFTVSAAFDFWDNNTIRLASGNGTVYDFDLQNISNYISEPSATTNRYVSTSGNDSNNGTTEALAWRTIDKAGGTATAGQTVWIKAGNYGNENVSVTNDGTTNSPIKFIGYTTTIGDSPDLNWSYNSGSPTAFNSAIMPLLSGSNELINRGFQVQGDFIIVKNIQIEKYDRLFHVNGQHNSIYTDNILTQNGTYGHYIDNNNNSRIRTLNALAFRTRTAGLRIYGDHNKIENCIVWDDRFDGANKYANDYYISWHGSDNIIRGNHIERVGNTEHDGHGYSEKSVGNVTEYNLLENSTARGINLSVEKWGSEVKYNVARNIYVDRDNATWKSDTGGVDLLGSASDNIFDGIYVDNTDRGFFLIGGNNNNIFKNCISSNNTDTFRIDGTSTGNKFINCTFYNDGSVSGRTDSPITFINTSFTDISSNGSSSSSTYTNSNFYNGFTAPSGTNITTLDPDFVDEANLDFTLNDTSGLIDIGADNTNVRYDPNGIERLTGKYSIGAFELDGYDFYFAQTNGDDTTGDGTLATPWKTTTKFDTESSSFANKTVVFEGGQEFYGGISLTSIDGVTIKSYGTGGKAILKGHKGYNTWASEGGNIYSASITEEIYQVFEGENVLQQARYPKIVSDTSTESNYYSVTSTSSTTKFICSALIGFPNIVGATVQINGNEWDTNARTISTFTSGTGEVTLSGTIDGGLSSGDLFWIVDDYDLLDADEEWYYDDVADKLYVYDTGGSPTNIKGQTFNGSAITLTTSDNITVENITIKNYNTHGIDATASDTLTVDGVDFLYCYTTGVYTGTTTSLRTTVKNSYFKGSMENAININNNKLYTDISESTITGNTIFEHGLLKQATNAQYNIPHAIRLQGSTHTMTYNDMQMLGGNGVRIYGRDTDVMYNYIKDAQLTNHDQGSIYSQGGGDKSNNQVQNMNIQYNVIENTFTASANWLSYGIYIDDNSTSSVVDQNTVEGGVNGIFLHNTKDVDVTTNNLYGQSLESLIMIEGSQWGSIAMTGNSMTNNDVLNNNTNEALYVRNTRSGIATYNFGDLDYNNYWNTGNTDDVHHNTTQEQENEYTLSAWATKYSSEMTTTQEANSTSDLSETVSDRQIVVNLTSSAVNKSITGTWYDLDGNSYSGSITLQPYTSEILIQQ